MYFPLHGHSTFSLLDSTTQPHQLALRLRKLGLAGAVVSDHASVSAMPGMARAFAGACRHCGHQKNSHADGGKGSCQIAGEDCPGYETSPLKLVPGSEFNCCHQDAAIKDKTNRSYSHLVVLAKTAQGWRNLVRATTESYKLSYYKPRLDLERLASFSKGELLVVSGHPGSTLADVCWGDRSAAYAASTETAARSFLKPAKQLKADLLREVHRHVDLFGRDNVRLEVQLVDASNMPATGVLAGAMRWVSGETGLKCVATADSHYCKPEDAADQRVLLCASLKTSLREVDRKLAAGDDVTLGGFFRSNNYHVPGPEEMLNLHRGHEHELANTLEVAELCEAFKMPTGQPRLPHFPLPEGVTPDERLRELCRDGWRAKIQGKVPADRLPEYGERVREELGVFSEFGLSPYFLVTHDLVRHAQDKLGCPKTDGRGSVSGSLACYLLGIHDCEPIRYGLSFARFLNKGRLTKDKVSLPDIDLDFPPERREEVIRYLQDKYGHDRVCAIGTFGRMQGRTALDVVLKAHSWGTFAEQKRVTAAIPDKAKIDDQLQAMREETGEASILDWALENRPKELSEWVKMGPDGRLEGPLAMLYEQARRLEGCCRQTGVHASGIIVGDSDLSDEVPLKYEDGSDLPTAMLEMGELDAMGLLKTDVLGLNTLSKLLGVERIIHTGAL